MIKHGIQGLQQSLMVTLQLGSQANVCGSPSSCLQLNLQTALRGSICGQSILATFSTMPCSLNYSPTLARSLLSSTGTVFVVQWDHVYLQGREDKGSFTFQAALHRDGRIVFGYKEVSPTAEMAGSRGAFVHSLNSCRELPMYQA